MAFKKGHKINKGRVPWNKGMKGLLLNDIFLTNNPSTGGKDSPNWKGGISKIGNCLDCGKKLKSYPSKYCRPCSYKHRRYGANAAGNHYNWKGGKPKCLDCGKEIAYGAKHCSSCAKLGNRNNSWNGGSSFLDYPTVFNDILKKSVRKRDGYACCICSCTEEELGKSLDVHHIDYKKDNCNPDNLISLCNRCHSKTNYNRERWVSFFEQYV